MKYFILLVVLLCGCSGGYYTDLDGKRLGGDDFDSKSYIKSTGNLYFCYHNRNGEVWIEYPTGEKGSDGEYYRGCAESGYFASETHRKIKLVTNYYDWLKTEKKAVQITREREWYFPCLDIKLDKGTVSFTCKGKSYTLSPPFKIEEGFDEEGIKQAIKAEEELALMPPKLRQGWNPTTHTVNWRD